MAEDFDYLNSNINDQFVSKGLVSSDEMFQREVNERAKLLFNLKYDAKATAARIKQNVEWEFDDAWKNSRPGVYKEIDRLVKDLYKRMKNKAD